MNTSKIQAKLIMLLLSAVVALSSCSSSASKPTNTSKDTPIPAVSTQTPTVAEKTATATPQSSGKSSETTYILNMNTKKFHYPSCSSVNNMKEKNKREFTGTRDEAISRGYASCKRCNP